MNEKQIKKKGQRCPLPECQDHSTVASGFCCRNTNWIRRRSGLFNLYSRAFTWNKAYKSPGDYLSVDDFYKIYGYTCFYKSNTRFTDTIKFCDLTITFVSESYPRKLIRHLQKTHNYQSKEIESGIYYIIGAPLPIQIIVTSKLSKKENLWLGNLTNHLKNIEEVQDLLSEYKKQKKIHFTNP